MILEKCVQIQGDMQLHTNLSFRSVVFKHSFYQISASQLWRYPQGMQEIALIIIS